MPRKPREYSVSSVYHIIFRGNDRQDIFYDEQDRYVFLNKLKENKKKFNYSVYAYCLMDNHIHIVIKIKDNFLSKSMQILETGYSIYLNKKLKRSGHLFENRFFSKKIEDLNYFILVCKYVHRNPEKANMEKTEKYKWSSFEYYVNKEEGFVDKNILMHYFNNNLKEFKDYMLKNDDKEQIYNLAEFELKSKLSEEELANIIKIKFNLKNASDVSLLNKETKDRIIASLKNVQGTSIAQISRVIKITPYYIKKIWR